jgi:hypothetical protein
LICSHESCTGHHDDRDFSTLCPRTREAKRERSRQWDNEHRQQAREHLRRYRMTAAGMVAAVNHEAHRRGSR